MRTISIFGRKMPMLAVMMTILTIVFSVLPSSAGITINTITDMPENMVAGSTYQVNYTFTTSHQMNVSINFSAMHTETNFGDWDVWYVLNGSVIVPHEPIPGQFTSGDISVNASEHSLIITFSSVPNLAPGEHVFTIDIISDEDAPEQATVKKSSGGGRKYPTPTPTPTPSQVNATSEPTQTAIVDDGTNVSDDNVSEAPQEPDKDNTILYGIIGVIVAAILIYLYGLHRKQ